MAGKSTISITFKVNGDSSGFKALAKDSEGLKKALSSSISEAERLKVRVDDVGKSASGAAAGIAKMAKAFGLVGGTAAVVGVLKSSVSLIKEFEYANSELAAVLGTSRDGVKDLTAAAQELGRTTKYSASEVTALQTSLARLGFNQGQIKAMQEPVLKFAAAVGTDLGSAADFAGAALRSFGLKAEDTGALLDIMAASTSKSALSFSKLQASISIVGPVAKTFGLSVSDATALLGVLSNAGFDASSAATALRNILLNLADSNGKLAQGLGHSAKTMPEIIAALKELRDKGIDLSESLEMTDKRSVAAFSALVDGADSVDALNTELKNANGSLEQMYGTMTDNLTGAIASLNFAWQGLQLSFSESAGPMTEVVSSLANLINLVTTLRNKTKDATGVKKFFLDVLNPFNELKKGVSSIGQFAGWLNDKMSGGKGAGTDQEYADIKSTAASVETAVVKANEKISTSTKTLGKEVQKQLRTAFAPVQALNGGSLRNLGGAERTGAPTDLPTLTRINIEPLADAYTLVDALSGAFGQLGASIDGVAGSWASWLSGVLGSVGPIVSALSAVSAAHRTAATAAAAQGISEATAFAAMGGPFLAVAAGAAVAAGLLGAIAAIPKMANGGLVSAPTLALVGEYSGATNNPEVVAPLNKLRSMLAPASQMFGDVEFVIRGRDLIGIYKGETNRIKRVG